MKTSELTGAALDWAVAKCERRTIDYFRGIYKPTTDWAQGGPIIEREGIALYLYGDSEWQALLGDEYKGTTPLIAAMRCYVASKLGNEVEVLDELQNK